MFGVLACVAPPDPDPVHLPAIEAVTLAPDPLRADSLARATATGDASTWQYTWYVDDRVIHDAGPSLSGFARGEQVRVKAVGLRDGRATEPLTSPTLIVVNTPPTAPRVAITGTGPLTCAVTTPSTDIDGDVVTYDFTWDPVAAGETVSADEAARAATWTCTVTPSDGIQAGEAASASVTLSGPAPSAYAFEKVLDLPFAADLAALPDGTLLAGTLLGEVLHIDPVAGVALGSATPFEPDDLIAIALDPEFGDGTHDFLYTWTNNSCLVSRFPLTLEPFALGTREDIVAIECGGGPGHSGGDLLWWSGETSEPALYVATGPTTGSSPQDPTNLGQKLLVFGVDRVTGAISAVLEGDTPYVAALGLRNPWRLVDCGAAICIADPGSVYYEEVNLYTGAGMNFGFPRVEGPGDGTYDEPVVWWHDDDLAQILEDEDGPGRAGFVNTPVVGVRVSGTAYAGRLDGWLLYGDLYDGWVRARQVYDSGVPGADVPIAHLAFLMSMAEAPDGTVYAAEMGGSIQRLVLRTELPTVGDEGDALSAANMGGISYDVRFPLWSNGAGKERTVQLLPGTTVGEAGWPDGARLWKTFTLRGAPVETRVIEKRDGRWIGGVYVWDGADAFLTDGRRKALTLDDGTTYTVPATNVCGDCHDATRGREWPLGIEPFQLGEVGVSALTPIWDDPPEPLYDVATDPIEIAARGWLHGNCAYCHQPGAVSQNVSVVYADFRYDAVDMGLDGVAQYWHANPNNEDGTPYLDPENPRESALIGMLEAADMPTVSVWEPDLAAIDDLREWMMLGM